MPKVSVVIPTHNRAEFLRSAIISILNQSFQDIEIIIVDDASRDNTYETVASFNDRRIKYVHHDERKGGSASRNTGIKLSQGKYIALLDDDDEWLSGKLDMQVRLLESSLSDIGAIYTGFVMINRDTGKIVKKVTPKTDGHLLVNLLKNNYIGTASTLLIRRECFDKVGLFDENLQSCQDWDMWIRLSKVYQFKYIKEALVKYYIHGNMISNNMKGLIKGREEFHKKYEKLFEELLDKKSYSKHYYILGAYYYHNKNFKKALKAFLRCMKIYPLNLVHLPLSISTIKNLKFNLLLKLKNLK